MRIILSNKFYYPRGGDCTYTLSLEKLLQKKGHTTAIFTMDNSDNLESLFKDYFPSEVSFNRINTNLIESVLRPLGTKEVKRKFNKLLDDFNPDILHLNNIHTQISPVIAEIAHKRGVKVVWTLHDYKLLCPRYDCLRNDVDICELCFKDKTNVLLNKCMKNSFFGSIIAYLEAIKWTKDKLEKYTDTFICPSQFIYNKMLEGGYNKDKLLQLYNFIEAEKIEKNIQNKEDYFCYIGRLSKEKGISTLINAANDLSYKLKIIGSGPLENKLKSEVNNSNTDFLGHKNWNEISQIIGKAKFLVVPSEWYENNPLSIIEALCLGTPIIGANIGGIPELINNSNGVLFTSGNSLELKETIINAWNNFPDTLNYKEISDNAQKQFNEDFYYKELINIYKK